MDYPQLRNAAGMARNAAGTSAEYSSSEKPESKESVTAEPDVKETTAPKHEAREAADPKSGSRESQAEISAAKESTAAKTSVKDLQTNTPPREPVTKMKLTRFQKEALPINQS